LEYLKQVNFVQNLMKYFSNIFHNNWSKLPLIRNKGIYALQLYTVLTTIMAISTKSNICGQG
jgi:hypothetical protein